MEYHAIDISDSELYKKSQEIDCLQQKHSKNNERLYDIYSDDVTRYYDGFIDQSTQFHIQTVNFESKMRCFNDELFRKSSHYPDFIGYEANRGMMYKLDEFNTYNNYPVCKVREEKQQGNLVSCCPKNVQIFDNLTRRRYAYPQEVKQERNILLVEETKIPELKFHQCRLP